MKMPDNFGGRTHKLSEQLSFFDIDVLQIAAIDFVILDLFWYVDWQIVTNGTEKGTNW